MVLLSQCGAWQEILTVEEVELPGLPQTIRLTIPSTAEFDDLLCFLHDQDEQRLYNSLLDRWDNGTVDGEHALKSFALNVRYLGILDARISGVLRAVIEPAD